MYHVGYYMLVVLFGVSIVIRALDLRLEIASSLLAAALSSATLGKLYTHIYLCHQAV